MKRWNPGLHPRNKDGKFKQTRHGKRAAKTSHSLNTGKGSRRYIGGSAGTGAAIGAIAFGVPGAAYGAIAGTAVGVAGVRRYRKTGSTKKAKKRSKR